MFLADGVAGLKAVLRDDFCGIFVVIERTGGGPDMNKDDLFAEMCRWST